MVINQSLMGRYGSRNMELKRSLKKRKCRTLCWDKQQGHWTYCYPSGDIECGRWRVGVGWDGGVEVEGSGWEGEKINCDH